MELGLAGSSRPIWRLGPTTVNTIATLSRPGLRRLNSSRLWGDWRLALLHRNKRARPAEIAALRRACGIEGSDRLATLAFYRSLFRGPSALLVGDAVQGHQEIVLLDFGARRWRGHRRFCAAIRAHKSLLGWVPLRLRTTGGAGKLGPGGDLGHRVGARPDGYRASKGRDDARRVSSAGIDRWPCA